MFDYIDFKIEYFKDINLNDIFFDSFKKDYPEFKEWFIKKENNKANVYYVNNEIKGFVYIEERDEKIKLCTLKLEKECSFHFNKIISFIIKMAKEKNKNIYCTVYPNHEVLIKKIKEAGFIEVGNKNKELVYEYVV